MTAGPVLALALAALPDVLTLDEALRQAEAHHPSLAQARAGTEVAEARARQALAPLLPQASFNLSYSRSTANFAPRPGAVPQNINMATALSAQSFDFFTGQLSASLLAWDFLSTWSSFQAARAQVDAQAAQVQQALADVRLQVRVAYFAVAAQRELLEVARATLANVEAHGRQVEGFVKVGTRPDIDLAQARAETANARLAALNARTALQLSKAQLNLSMGVAGTLDYEVGSEALPAVDVEGQPLEAVLEAARGGRPALAQVRAQARGQALATQASRAQAWPTLGVNLALSAQARELSAIVPNGSVQAQLSWPFLDGLRTPAAVAQAEAASRQAEAQVQAVEAQVRFEVQQALLDLEGAREAVAVAGDASAAAEERLKLAQGRYRAGAGSALEVGDAQVAFTSAQAQRVQAGFNVSVARARLLAALGR